MAATKKIPAVKKTSRSSSTAKKTASRKTASKKTAKPAAKKRTPQKAPAKKTAVAKPIKTASSSRPSGLPEQMRDAALRVLDERQAEEILTFDLFGRSSVADYLIVASGRAARQIVAIAHYLADEFAKLGIKRVRLEGLSEANWVLVDAGDVIIHLFRPEVRRYYDIENIWKNKSQK